MGNSISLALYLATRGRSDRAARRAAKMAGDGEKDIEKERLGEASVPRPDAGPLIWFHTGMDRHGLASRELATRMKSERADLSFLMTTSAKNRRETEPCVISQRVPNDTVPTVRRFLDHWKPDIAVFTEPDLRPALIAETADRDIPLFMVDAHTAAPDPQSWRWLRGMTGSLLERFQFVMAGDADAAASLKRLGAVPEKLETTGYLEEGSPALPCNESERDALASILATRPVWLAVHVTPTECATVIAAHSRAQRRSHRLLLILVPDTPGDGALWARHLAADGLHVALRSGGEEPAQATQVYIADTVGEMGLWYRLSAISFLGRSLSADGGVNPYEPAALGSAVVHGPNVRNFRQAFARLGAVGATRLVRNEKELARTVERLLSPDVAASMAHEAWKVCSSGAEVTDRVRDLIFTELEEREMR